MNNNAAKDNEYFDFNGRGADPIGNWSRAKGLFRALSLDARSLGSEASKRVSLEAEEKLNDLRDKIFSGVTLTLVSTYAAFWTFAAISLWLTPAVPLVYSFSAVALLHIVLALVLLYQSRKPIAPDKNIQVSIEKSKNEVTALFKEMTSKTEELKNVANASLNPLNTVKRNPEAFLLGSFAVGAALSLFGSASWVRSPQSINDTELN